MKTESVLSWFGSDSEVAAELAKLFDHCKHVTIPFVGGAAIIQHLKARAVLANDKHAAAINFYRVLCGVFGPEAKEQLIERCKHTLSHPDELDLAKDLLGQDFASAAKKAWAFWATCWIPRKGQGGTTKQADGPLKPSVRFNAGGGQNGSRIKAAAGDLEEWSQKLAKCDWLQEDFRTVIPRCHDREDCGIYCDFVWVTQGKGYLHAASPGDHFELARLLERFADTTIVLRYGDDPLIRRLYSEEKWRWIDSESRTQSNAVKSEVWITNRRI